MNAPNDRFIIALVKILLAWCVGIIPFILLAYFIEDPVDAVFNFMVYGVLPFAIGLLLIDASKTLKKLINK